MLDARHDLPSLRFLKCLVVDNMVTVDGLPYALAEHPHALGYLARAGRVRVIVDLDDIDSVLVQGPWDGSLHRLACLISQEARLGQLAGWFGAGASMDHDVDATSPRLRSAA